jgi:predicted nucleotidyltransferase
MVKKEIVETEKTLRKLLKKRGIDANKIVIFGSYAKEEQKKDSDIDVIVVSEDFRNKDIFAKINLTKGIHRELVKKIKKPFDIMYYSDIEWEEGCSLVINAAKEEGFILYPKR